MHPTDKAGFDKIDIPLLGFQSCSSIDHIYDFIYGDGLHKLLKFNKNRENYFQDNRYLAFWSPFNGPSPIP
jgi:hypothetical protein